jgi:hypothetical protein
VDAGRDTTLTDDDVITTGESERSGWVSAGLETDADTADDSDAADADADDSDQDADADDPSL